MIYPKISAMGSAVTSSAKKSSKVKKYRAELDFTSVMHLV